MVLEMFVPLLQMSSGRRISVLNQMRQLAVDTGQPTLVARIDRALAHDAITRDYDNQWAEPSRRSLYTPEVQEHDRSVDIVLTSVRDIAVAQTRGLPESDPLVGDTEAMLGDVFPAGVGAIAKLPYIDEVAACEVILDKLRGRWAATVTALGLDQRVAFLDEATRQYRAAIDQERNLTFATVQAFRQRGQEMLRELVVHVLALYSDSTDPVQVKAREHLLEPLVIQLDDIRARNRLRRNRPDDVLDGEPVDDGPLDDEPVDDGPLDGEPVDDGPLAGEPVDDGPLGEMPGGRDPEPVPPGPIGGVPGELPATPSAPLAL